MAHLDQFLLISGAVLGATYTILSAVVNLPKVRDTEIGKWMREHLLASVGELKKEIDEVKDVIENK